MPVGFAYNLGEYAFKSADINHSFEVTGLAELSKKLDALLLKCPDMEKKIRKIIGKALKQAEKKMEKYADTSVLKSDPLHAAKAIRYTVYRRILGGNLNILHGKQRGAATGYTPARHPSSGRGGNRKARSERTTRMEGYEGADRSFILRFQNAGARKGGGNRQLGKTNFKADEHRAKVNRGIQGGDVSKYGNLANVNTGNRGYITAKHWFGSISDYYMQEVAATIEHEVDKAIAEVFGNG
jgi:hypothetical protein